MNSLAAEERRSWLLEHLRASKTITLTEAADALGVSEMTVRRDLNSLERNGTARRVRGGAVYSGPVRFHGRERSHVDEKQKVAEKLLPLVPSQGVIALDSSTTMHRLAQMISPSEDLVVVTNGLVTFQVLQDRPNVTAILTGGAADRRSDSLIGPVATACIEGMRFSQLFASAAALDQRACYEDTLEEAEIKRAFARSSAQVIIGVHSDKLGDNATAIAITLNGIDVLATERDPSDPDLQPYRSLAGDLR
ncbi:DeoR/GlpR family transcriptional regulator of sugar metabolism [Arthrobacter pigmenti]|uniref:DeoR/GlpR family transcriptional regulator of sugar metabolism n=1 Tax=Arthrobacter pigmenti TaxID=271432 RepID=A0A846RES0_9MICC|nr:DeoR/GlpR family DNA-binding transcription regulator [Arthrobacter pigmenti]NJC21543.1 DeoR/GlpR family transcriptional regulator of sugar metabolism [Arthrobacter pigmenti]